MVGLIIRVHVDSVSGIKSKTMFAQVGRTTLGQTCQEGQKVSRIPEERVRHPRDLSRSYSISCLHRRVSAIGQFGKLSCNTYLAKHFLV